MSAFFHPVHHSNMCCADQVAVERKPCQKAINPNKKKISFAIDIALHRNFDFCMQTWFPVHIVKISRGKKLKLIF